MNTIHELLCKYTFRYLFTWEGVSTINNDLYTCLNQLKQALKTEEKYVIKIIRKKNSSSTTLSMRIYKAIMKILYVIIYLILCIHCLKKKVFKIPKHYKKKQKTMI